MLTEPRESLRDRVRGGPRVRAPCSCGAASAERCGRPASGLCGPRRRAGRRLGERERRAFSGVRRGRLPKRKQKKMLFVVLAHRTEDSLESREAEVRVAQTSAVRQGK